MTAKPEETSAPKIVEEAEAIVEDAVSEETSTLKDRVISGLKDPALYKRIGLFVAGVATTAAIVIITKKGGLEFEEPETNEEIETSEDSEES